MTRQNKQAQRIGLILISVPGYSETFFRSKIEGLQSHGFEVVLFVFYPSKENKPLPCEIFISPSFSGGFIKKGVRVFKALLQAIFVSPLRSFKLVDLDRKDGKGLGACFKNMVLNQFIISKKLDWIHFGFGTLAVGKENLAGVMNAKMGVSFRGFDLYLSPLKRENYYSVLFSKKVRYHVLSEEMKYDLIKQDVPEQCAQVISPAINTSFFKTSQSHSSGPVLQILTVGRLHWKKGLEYTLEAMAALKELGVDFIYTIIGAGEEIERLKFATHQLGISKQIHFVGQLKPAEVRDFMSKTDMYVQYSIQEGFCNAVLEAQAMGLLCLVSDAEGLAENVIDGQTGWVILKRSPKVLAQKIITVLNLSEIEKQTIRDRARLRVEQQFNIEKQQKEFVQFYTE